MSLKFTSLTCNKTGFTLIELAVVVAIIGVLLAIAVPIFSGIQEKAKENACAANVHIISGAVAIYKAEKGQYPAEVGALVTDGYLQAEPACPLNGVYIINMSNGLATCTHSGIEKP